MALRPGFTWTDAVACRAGPNRAGVHLGSVPESPWTPLSPPSKPESQISPSSRPPGPAPCPRGQLTAPGALFTFLQQPFSQDPLAFRSVWQQSPSCIPAQGLQGSLLLLSTRVVSLGAFCGQAVFPRDLTFEIGWAPQESRSPATPPPHSMFYGQSRQVPPAAPAPGPSRRGSTAPPTCLHNNQKTHIRCFPEVYRRAHAWSERLQGTSWGDWVAVPGQPPASPLTSL